MKQGKFYVHVEDVEPNMTLPFALDPGLTFTEVADKFCAKYNAKNGAKHTIDSSLVTLKAGSKAVDLGDMVADHISPGDDLFVLASPALAPPSSTPQDAPAAPPPAPSPAAPAPAPAPAAPPQQAAQGLTPVGKKFKVYLHYEGGQRGDVATQVLQVEWQETTVGDLITDFVAKYNEKHTEGQLDVYDMCARNDALAVLPADARVCKAAASGDDLWVVPLEVAVKEDNTKGAVSSDANGVQRSNQKAKDKSYYYWAKKPTGEEPAPREAPKQIRKREATKEEKEQFKTISKYAFDSEGGFVSIYITMPGVQDLPAGSHEFECAERSMSLRVFGYQGFNHRLQVPKLSEEIDPSRSTVKVKKDMLLVKLAKVKKDHHWYELHKTKGIGEE